MAMNRVQFQAGLSMAEFLDRYGSEDKCEAALVAARWPKGFACPACGGRSQQFVRRAGAATGSALRAVTNAVSSAARSSNPPSWR